MPLQAVGLGPVAVVVGLELAEGPELSDAPRGEGLAGGQGLGTVGVVQVQGVLAR